MFYNSEHADANRDLDSNGFIVRVPAVSLPKGGGTIRGIGEKFAANPVTGTGSMPVPRTLRFRCPALPLL